MAILSQAGGIPPEGAETTWGLTVKSQKVLNNRQERPAPKQHHINIGVVGDEIVHSFWKQMG